MRRILPLILPLILAAPAPAQTAPETQATMPPIAYPHTRTVDQVDEQFGIKVADPYRWLEGDVRSDPEVKAWVDAQTKLTDAYLATLPGRDWFRTRIKQLFDFERFGVPVKKGGRYFYTHNSGLQNQAVLFVRDGLNGEGRALLDPNSWSADGATALAEWVPSEDGSHLLYSIQDGGTDWRTLKVVDAATGQGTGDEIKWVKTSAGTWNHDGTGFFYSRFPEPPAGATYQATNENNTIYFHKLGTPQSEDRLVYATPENPRLGHFPGITDDGRWLVIITAEGTDNRYSIEIVDLTDPKWTVRPVIKGLDNEWSPIGNRGSTFYFMTNKDAPARAHRHARRDRGGADAA